MDIRDVEDAYLGAKREFDREIEEMELEFYAPQLIGDAAQMIANIPPEVLRRLPPEVASNLLGILGGRK